MALAIALRKEIRVRSTPALIKAIETALPRLADRVSEFSWLSLARQMVLREIILLQCFT
jgi:hypothetical protein